MVSSHDEALIPVARYSSADSDLKALRRLESAHRRSGRKQHEDDRDGPDGAEAAGDDPILVRETGFRPAEDDDVIEVRETGFWST